MFASYKTKLLLASVFCTVIAVPPQAQAQITSAPLSNSSVTTYDVDQAPITTPSDSSSYGSSSSTSSSFGNWDLTLGFGFINGPKYAGSSKYTLSPMPLINAVYKDTYFLSGQGVGMNAVNWRGLKLGPTISVAMGRDEGDSPILNNMGRISPTLQAGAFISYDFNKWNVKATINHALTHMEDYGTSGSLAANYKLDILPGTFDMTMGPEVGFADRDYMQTWFGVTDDQAAGTGLSRYSPGGGIKDIAFNFKGHYAVTHDLGVLPYIKIDRLVGDDVDSPLNQEKAQVSAGAAIAYHF